VIDQPLQRELCFALPGHIPRSLVKAHEASGADMITVLVDVAVRPEGSVAI
jgi:hypothetical protein